MFSCTWLLQQTAANIRNFLSQKLEAKIVSLVFVHCHAHRFGLSLCCRRFVQYGVRNCESTLMQLWKCFTVSPLRSACLPMHQTTMKTKDRQLQCACKTRWLSRVATVRARSEILAFWAALNQLSENKNDAMWVKADCEKFGSEFGELRTRGSLTDTCVSSGMRLWKDTERLAN